MHRRGSLAHSGTCSACGQTQGLHPSTSIHRPLSAKLGANGRHGECSLRAHRQPKIKGESNMWSIKKILVPTDFSKGSETSLDAAVELAKKFDAALVLMHAYQVPVYAYPASP